MGTVLSLSFTTGKAQLTANTWDSWCGAGQLRISGVAKELILSLILRISALE
jgi:hypothetical protein